MNILKLLKKSQFSLFSQLQSKFASTAREVVEYDVAVVGAGPAGLSTAIRLKQLSNQFKKPINVCLLEKGSDVGSHILSGCILQSNTLEQLFKGTDQTKLKQFLSNPVTKDDTCFCFNEKFNLKIPELLLPSEFSNHGNFIISLSDLTKYMGEYATSLGIDIFTQTTGYQLNYNDKGQVTGVITGDKGFGKNGEKLQNFQPGIEIKALQTVLAEGPRGYLTERTKAKFNLDSKSDPQSYSLGIKEIWEIPPEKFHRGYVMHTVGYPLDSSCYGGGAIYHYAKNQIHISFVIGLNYANPYISPYDEFQKWKSQKIVSQFLVDGKCIQYGARVIGGAGYFALPKLTFPGGLIVGCGAGFLNLLKLKGVHNAVHSGMIAAQSIFDEFQNQSKMSYGKELLQYEESIKNSEIYKELYKVRNSKNAFKKGLYGGLLYNGFSGLFLKGKEPWNFRNHKKDSEYYSYKGNCKVKVYPKPDQKITFDILSSVAKSGVNHRHDQPSHLLIKKNLENAPQTSLSEFDGPEQRFCPAKVYEYVKDEKKQYKLQINFINCLHCQCCSIKMPKEYIDWTVPEGNGGPNYVSM